MSKRSAGILIAALLVSGSFIFVAPFEPSLVLAQAKNTLSFDNKSGQEVVVRVFDQNTDKRIAEVKVSDGQTRGTSISDGHYYIVAKYSTQTDRDGKASHTYSKGDPITIRTPPGKRGRVTITLHKVIHGNYGAVPADENAFER
jgi:hypothetical protein